MEKKDEEIMNTIKIVIFLILACVIFITGCIEEEGITPSETPIPTTTPGEIVSTPTPVPTPIPTPEVWEPEVTLKQGYEWYQDNEYEYGFAYPEEWEKVSAGGEGTVGGIVFQKSNPEGFPDAMVMVLVYTNSSEMLFWEDNPEWNKLGGFEKAKQMGYVSEYGDITINGRKGFEAAYDPKIFMMGASVLNETLYIEAGISHFTPTWSQKVVKFDVGDLDYVMIFSGSIENYNIYKNTYDDIVNSFIIR